MQLISVHWFYILTLYWIPVWVIEVLEWSLLGFPHKGSYMQRMRVWLILCWFGCLQFLFIVWLLRLGLAELCWIAVVIVDIPAVFLTLGEKLSVSPHWEWYSLWVFHRWLWWYWGMCPLTLHCEGFWSGKDAVLCQMFFQHLLRVSYGSCSFFY